MISKDDILKLQTRRIIYDFILKNPGLNLREIQRRLNIPLGGLRYHLGYLEKLDLILFKPDKKYKRYYVKDTIGRQDKEILNLLRQETTLRIVVTLTLPGPGNIYRGEKVYQEAIKKHETFEKTYSIKEIMELTKNWGKGEHFHIHKHRTTIEFHLGKLLELDLVEKISMGKEIKYRLKDEDLIWAFFIKYKDALSKRSVNDILNWRSDGYVSVADNIINVTWEIFPHPYHA